jgi:hypothetical protein
MPHELDVAVIAVLAASALLWSLVSARLEWACISAPMAFVVLGLVSRWVRTGSSPRSWPAWPSEACFRPTWSPPSTSPTWSASSSLFMWFAFGAAMLVPAIDHARWQDVVFGVLALTARGELRSRGCHADNRPSCGQ